MNRNTIQKILRLTNALLPYLIVLTFIFIFIESVTYIGFLKHFFFLDSINSRFFTIMGMLVVFIDFFMYSDVKRVKKVSFKDLVFKINIFFLPFILGLYLFLNLLESSHYPNYVFSLYHIQPQNLIYAVLLSALMFIVSVLNRLVLLGHSKRDLELHLTHNLTKFQISVIIILIINLAFYIAPALKKYAQGNMYIFTHLDASYDDRMRLEWGPYYDYMIFVKNNTPPDAKILIPPQSNYPYVGNAFLDRYFLYPRHLANGTLENISTQNFDYVLINPGWPKEKVETEKIMLFNVNENTTQIFGNYDPDKMNNDMGLMKLMQ